VGPPAILTHVRAPGRRARRILIVVAALVVINVPYAVHQWQLHRVGSDGTTVTATIVSADRTGDDVVLTFTLPATVDPDQKVRTARVDAAHGEAAATSGEVDVRVLEGHPAVYELDGQKRGHGATVATLGADLLLLLVLLLSWRLGTRLRRPALVAVALGDVESGEEGSLLDKQDDGTYLINGEISEAGADSMVLTLRDRDVTVHLRGHANPVDVGERAKVHAHLVG
jgi:hypothetical protein